MKETYDEQNPFTPSPDVVDALTTFLTDTQAREIYNLFGEGFPNDMIADEMRIDIKLVKKARRAVNDVHEEFEESYSRNLPSMVEIAERAAAIRAGWSEQEEADRRGCSIDGFSIPIDVDTELLASLGEMV